MNLEVGGSYSMDMLLTKFDIQPYNLLHHYQDPVYVNKIHN